MPSLRFLTALANLGLVVLLIPVFSPLCMVNDTLLNFGKRYEGDLRVMFNQWQKLSLGLDALSNQKILKGI